MSVLPREFSEDRSQKIAIYGYHELLGLTAGLGITAVTVIPELNHNDQADSIDQQIKPLQKENDAIAVVKSGPKSLTFKDPAAAHAQLLANTHTIQKLEASKPEPIPGLVEGGIDVAGGLLGAMAMSALTYRIRRHRGFTPGRRVAAKESV